MRLGIGRWQEIKLCGQSPMGNISVWIEKFVVGLAWHGNTHFGRWTQPECGYSLRYEFENHLFDGDLGIWNFGIFSDCFLLFVQRIPVSVRCSTELCVASPLADRKCSKFLLRSRCCACAMRYSYELKLYHYLTMAMEQ